MTLKKGMLYVFVANLINLFLSLFTGFVLPKMLSVETYANIKLFQLYLTYIGVLSLGFGDGMYLRLGGKKLQELDYKSINSEFKTYCVFQCIISIFALLCTLFFKNKLLFFCSLVIVPVNVANYLRNLYQAIGKFDLYSKFMNVNTFLIFVINVFLLFVIKTDYSFTYILFYVFAYFIYLIYILLETNKIFGFFHTKTSCSRTYFLEDIRNGFLLMVGNFGNVLFTSIDRVFVQKFLGAISFAFYSFAVSIENLMNVLISPISTVLYNYFCIHHDTQNIIYMKRILLLFSTLLLFVIFPVRFVVEIWISKYEASLAVLLYLFAAQYVSVIIRCVHTNLYKAQKRQKIYFLIMNTVFSLAIVLNFLFYYLFDNIESFAIATLLVNLIWFFIGELFFQNYRLSISDYGYFIGILVVFLYCNSVSNVFLSGFLFALFVLIFVLFFLRDVCFYCLGECQNFLKSKFKKN